LKKYTVPVGTAEDLYQYFFGQKMQFAYPSFIKDVHVTEEVFIPEKEKIQPFKTLNSFCALFLPAWIQIRIRNADPVRTDQSEC
jgi:hypothetical protein